MTRETHEVGVIGLGYVGCVTAACFSQLGHRVTGVDRDAYKIEKVQAGEAPFFEPGLEAAVRSGGARSCARNRSDDAGRGHPPAI